MARWRTVRGWQSLRRVRFRGLGARWFARCEVPTWAVLPTRYPDCRRAIFRAGLELHRMHFGLWLASWSVRCGLVRNMAPHAETLLALSNRWLDRGSDVGVMHVDMAGRAATGDPLRLRWTLVARNGEGPRIPATPAVLLARKLAGGALSGAGATICVDLFTLDECLATLASGQIEATLAIPSRGSAALPPATARDTPRGARTNGSDCARGGGTDGRAGDGAVRRWRARRAMVRRDR
jgi:hypothetical protein